MEPTAPLETLKAQAVAIRTFTLRNVGIDKEKPHTLHPGTDAVVCADYTHCMAYRSRQSAMGDWSAYADALANAEKFDNAISATDGQVLLYEDQPILAVFHAISSGKTESASEIWGGEYPYLVSVDSTDDEAAAGYRAEVSIKTADFKAKAQATWPKADLSGANSTWITDVKRSAEGSIMNCKIGGVTVSGDTLRNVLALRSANITITTTTDALTFQTKGYGHGVGMSQAGAIAMGVARKTYREILEHYYTNAIIDQIS